MSWGTIQVGRLTLRETVLAEDKVNANSGVRSMVITGQESTPPLTLAQLRQRREDIMGLQDRLVQVAFTDKSDLDGFYRVTDTGASQTNWQGEVAWVNWNISLELVGPANAVDLEDRLTAAGRINDFGRTGVSWHAPAVGAHSYYTGSTSPAGTVSRVGADGTVTVYLGLPDGANPRWGSTVAGYPGGRARFVLDGAERTGINLAVSGSAWSVSNSLTQVEPGASASLTVSSWGGAAWEDKSWDLFVGADLLSGQDLNAVTVLRNDYEMVTVRLVWSAPARHTLDLSLRRGARTVEGYLQTGTADTLWLLRTTAEAGTSPASAAYVTATANDADGNRFIVGSARTFTAQLVQGGLSASATRTLDFFVGAVVSGSGAATGDAAGDLRDQYLMAMADTTNGVRR